MQNLIALYQTDVMISEMHPRKVNFSEKDSIKEQGTGIIYNTLCVLVIKINSKCVIQCIAESGHPSSGLTWMVL